MKSTPRFIHHLRGWLDRDEVRCENGDVKVTERVKARIHVHRSLPEPAERRALREAAGLTQRELADTIGVDRTAITHWESGRRNPDGKRLDAYLEALGALREAA